MRSLTLIVFPIFLLGAYIQNVFQDVVFNKIQSTTSPRLQTALYWMSITPFAFLESRQLSLPFKSQISNCFQYTPVCSITASSNTALHVHTSTFHPPSGWKCADPSVLAPAVTMAFFKDTGKGVCPSINLAVEKTTVSLHEYLQAVKKIHEKDRRTHWRSLGTFTTDAGTAQLTEIEAFSEHGPLRIWQMILLEKGYAYILTAAAQKEEFSNYYKDFQTAFRSFKFKG